MAKLCTGSAVETEEVIAWLNSKQPLFTEALTEFARQIGVGFERNRKVYLKQFTGAGLCRLAAAVQEQALVRKYGDDIETYTYFLGAYRRDLNTYDNYPIEKIARHWIMFFKPSGDQEDWYFNDSTYRQFQIGVDPNQMLIGIPTNCREEIYGSDEIYKTLSAFAPALAETYCPVRFPDKTLYYLNLEDIKDGIIKRVPIKKYQELLDVFF